MALTFIQRLRGAVSFVGVGIKATAREADSSTPQVTSGAGAPGDVLPNGSIYLNTASLTPADSLWMRIGDSWMPLDGS